MKKRNRILATLIAIVSFAACTKIVSTDIGIGDLIPAVDGVLVKDTTLDVIINTYGDAITTTRISETNVLGKHSDTAFGNTTTALYLQVQPRSYPFRFPVSKDSITAIDSVVLVIPTYGLYYGDSTKNLGFRVYEVNDLSFDREKGYPFNTDKSFTTSGELTYNGAEQFISPLSVNDTIKSFGDTVGSPNQIRIRLSNALAQKFFNMDTANYRSDSLFRLAFNGIKITSTSGDALVPVLPQGAGIAMYYKYISKKDGSADTTLTSFVPAVTSASANHITVGRSGTQLANLPLGDINTGSSTVYLQSGPGVYARIKIPGLSGLAKMLIYRAELVVDDIPAAEYNKFVPNLFVAGIKDNKRILLKDVSLDNLPNPLNPFQPSNYFYTANLPTFGSYPLARVDSTNNLKYYQYNFNLTNHVQDINKGVTQNYPLDIFAPHADSVYSEVLSRNVSIQAKAGNNQFTKLNAPVIQRTKLFGNTAASAHKIRLNIIYSPVQ